MKWHQRKWQQFLANARAEKLAQTLLITGDSGCGCEEFVWQVAAYLLCKNATDNACGQCQSCRLLQNDSHPDCYPLDRERQSMSDIRQCLDKISRSAQLGRRKVVILDPVDTLSIASANALLKSLEEPPAETFFILLSFYPQQLLATITSRCLRLKLDKPSLSEASAWLQSIDETEHLQERLVIFDGAPLAVRDAEDWSFFLKIKQSLEACANQADALTHYADEFEKSDLDSWFQGVFYWLKSFMTDNEQQALAIHALALWDFCIEKRRNYQEVATLNKRLVIESIYCEWIKLCQQAVEC